MSESQPERLTATDEPGPAETEKAGLDESGLAEPSEGEGEGIKADLTTPVEHERVPQRDLSGSGSELAPPPGDTADSTSLGGTEGGGTAAGGTTGGGSV